MDPNVNESFSEFAKRIIASARALTQKERDIQVESIELLGTISKWKLYGTTRFPQGEFAEKVLGLSPKQYWTRVNAYWAFHEAPELRQMVKDKETSVSIAALVGQRVTPANREVLVEGIRGKTKKEAEAFVKRVGCDGLLSDPDPEVEVRVTLTREEFELLERLRQVSTSRGKTPSVGKVIAQAVEDSLEKRDPLRKAARAEKRQRRKAEEQRSSTASVVNPERRDPPLVSLGKSSPYQPKSFEPPALSHSNYIPAAIRHRVILDSGDRCTWTFTDGERCTERSSLENDHELPRGKGGGSELANIRRL